MWTPKWHRASNFTHPPFSHAGFSFVALSVRRIWISTPDRPRRSAEFPLSSPHKMRAFGAPRSAPVLGNIVGAETDRPVSVYTRTIILWAVGISIDTERLWEHMSVPGPRSKPRTLVLTENLRFEQTTRDGNTNASGCLSTRVPPPPVNLRKRSRGVSFDHRPVEAPVVLMMSTASKKRGELGKRDKSNQTFRSVLAVDIQYRSFPPIPLAPARHCFGWRGVPTCQTSVRSADPSIHLVAWRLNWVSNTQSALACADSVWVAMVGSPERTLQDFRTQHHSGHGLPEHGDHRRDFGMVGDYVPRPRHPGAR